jgi:ribonuclease HI
MTKITKFYVASVGKIVGIFLTWEDCKGSVNGVPNSKHASFQKITGAIGHLHRSKVNISDILVHTNISDSKSENIPVIEYCKKNNLTVDFTKFPDNNSDTDQKDDDSNQSPAVSTTTIVYVDGACQDNGGGLDLAKGGYGIYWGPDHPHNTAASLPLDGTPHTNNRAELYAAIKAIQLSKQYNIDTLTIRTDSQYVIQGITDFMHSWKESGKLQEHPNADLWIRLDNLCKENTVAWEHVRGHSNEPGNTAADNLANKGIHMTPDILNLEKVENAKNFSVNTTDVNQTSASVASCDNPESNGKISCLFCKEGDSEDMIQCDNCTKWVHYQCTKIPRYHMYLMTHSKRKFICEPCASETNDIPESFMAPRPRLSVSQPKCHNKEDSSSGQKSQLSQITQTDPVDQATISASELILEKIVVVEKTVAQLSDIKKVIRDMEKQFFEKLLNAKNENYELRIESHLCQLKGAKNEIVLLNSRIKDLTDKNNLLSVCKTETSKSTESINNVVDTQEKLKSVQAELSNSKSSHKKLAEECKKLSDSNNKLEDRIKQYRNDFEETAAIRKGLEIEMTYLRKSLERTDKDLNLRIKLLEKVEQDLVESNNKVNYLSDELISWKIHYQQPNTDVPFTMVPGGSPQACRTKPATTCSPMPLETRNRFSTLGENLEPDQTPENYATANVTTPKKSNQTSAAPPTSESRTVWKSNPKVPTPNKTNQMVMSTPTTTTGHVGDQVKNTAENHSTYTTTSISPDSTKNIKPNTDVLIIGNSHTSRIDPSKIYKAKKCEVRTLEKGLKNIDGAIDFVTKCNGSSSTQAVVLQVFSNSLSDDSVENCLTKCSELVKNSKLKFPNAQICVAETLPRQLQNPGLTRMYNDKSRSFNYALQKVQGVTIIRHENLQRLNTRLYDSGGIHLTSNGLAHFIRNYKSILNPILGLPDYNSYRSDTRKPFYQHQMNNRFEPPNYHDRSTYSKQNNDNYVALADLLRQVLPHV